MSVDRGGAPRTGSGVLIVDKPVGISSHDVVGRMRRQLGTRRVGHAGTLDPMASGVLVILVNEGTKLGPYLTAHTKRYLCRVTFGLATETLDREGTPTASAEVPGWLAAELTAIGTEPQANPALRAPRLEAALVAERARKAQVPPTYSAIKVDGRRSYARARAGEAFELAERPVEILSLLSVSGGEAHVDLNLEVSKGYYVRSLARDLGQALGVPAHLSALRRTASGPFTLADVANLLAPRIALISQRDAVRRSLPWSRLTEPGTRRAKHGQPLEAADFANLPPLDTPSAWLDEADHLVAIGTRRPDGFVLHRGFMDEDDPPSASFDPPCSDESPE